MCFIRYYQFFIPIEVDFLGLLIYYDFQFPKLTLSVCTNGFGIIIGRVNTCCHLGVRQLESRNKVITTGKMSCQFDNISLGSFVFSCYR